jgi:hypothetical protein
LLGHHDENDNTRLSLGPLVNSSVLSKGNAGAIQLRNGGVPNRAMAGSVVLRKTENSINEAQLKFLKSQNFSVYS